MQANTIDEAMQNLSKSNFAMGMVMIGMCIAVLALSGRFLYNAFAGPFPADEKMLTEMKNPTTAGKYFVIVKPDQIIATDIGWVKESRRGKDEKPTSALILLAVGHHLVPTRVDLDETSLSQLKGGTIIGELVKLEDKVHDLLKEEIKQPEVMQAVLPLELKASTSFKAVAWAECILFGLIAAVGAWKAFQAKVLWSDIEKHPLGVALARHGRPEAIKSEVNSDFTTNGVKLGKTGSIVGKHWALLCGLKPIVFKMEDLVWIYPSISTSKNSAGSKQHGVVVCLKSTERLERTMPEQDAREFVGKVADRAPWAYVGYDGTLALQWQGNAREVIAEVEKRKKANGAHGKDFSG